MKKTRKVAASKKGGMSGGKMVAIGAGVAAIGTGAYYFLGPNRKAHQKKVSILMTKMKRGIVSEIKKAEKISVPIYHKAVDIVSENYSKQYKAHGEDIKAIAKKLKSEWRGVNKIVKKTIRKTKKKI